MLSRSNTPPARKKGKEKHPQYAIPNKGTNISPLLFIQPFVSMLSLRPISLKISLLTLI